MKKMNNWIAYLKNATKTPIMKHRLRIHILVNSIFGIFQKKYRTIDSELKFQITYGTENMSRLSI